VLGEDAMFGFGYKARVEKIVEEELGYFVGATNSIFRQIGQDVKTSWSK